MSGSAFFKGFGDHAKNHSFTPPLIHSTAMKGAPGAGQVLGALDSAVPPDERQNPCPQRANILRGDPDGREEGKEPRREGTGDRVGSPELLF